MGTYIIRRLLQAIIVIFIITFIVFLVIRLLPGDPVLYYLSQTQAEKLTIDELEKAREEFGLNDPLPVQYVDWIKDLLRGDLGDSLFYREKVGSLIGERFPVTVYIGLIAFIFSHAVGILFGVISALRRGTKTDTFVTLLANIGITVPIFWLGILLIWVFGLQLDCYHATDIPLLWKTSRKASAR
jgi:peptide/nickel transport system permease protein